MTQVIRPENKKALLLLEDEVLYRAVDIANEATYPKAERERLRKLFSTSLSNHYARKIPDSHMGSVRQGRTHYVAFTGRAWQWAAGLAPDMGLAPAP